MIIEDGEILKPPPDWTNLFLISSARSYDQNIILSSALSFVSNRLFSSQYIKLQFILVLVFLKCLFWSLYLKVIKAINLVSICLTQILYTIKKLVQIFNYISINLISKASC